MSYCFDEPVERRGTACEKWDGMEEIFGRGDLLPFWVADMDFRPAPEIIDAVASVVARGTLGYPIMTDAAREAAAAWQRARYRREVRAGDIGFVPGVVAGLAAAVLEFTSPGDGVVIQTPVYPPFFRVVRDNGRRVAENPLVERGGRWEMDFDGLRRVITPDVKALILCSPHNPVARAWSREELAELASICLERGVVVLSDEIHQDLAYSDAAHTTLEAAAPELAGRAVTFAAPSKTFNIAGLAASVWMASGEAKERMARATGRLHISSLSVTALAGLEAAYTKGAAWHAELMAYLEGNRDFTEAFVRDRMPGVRLAHPEATYIFWLDFRGRGLREPELQRLLVDEARVALNPGPSFGAQGDGFARLNIGCPRAMLEEGLGRIAAALERRG